MSVVPELIAASRPCPTCRGFGYTGEGIYVRTCPECERREWEEFSQGLEDFPPCWGYASCRPECMGLCPWGPECKGWVQQ